MNAELEKETNNILERVFGVPMEVRNAIQLVTDVDRENVDGEVTYVMTERGSIYCRQEDGRMQRYKSEINELQEPQDVTAYISFADEKQADTFLEVIFLGGNERKVYLMDKDGGQVIKTNSDLQNAKEPFLVIFYPKENKVVGYAQASAQPKIGLSVYDQRYFEKDGETYREKHIGNTVAEIGYR